MIRDWICCQNRRRADHICSACSVPVSRPGRWLLILSLLAAVTLGGEFQVEGRRVSVRTERLTAVFDGLSLVSLQNHLTDETYADGAAAEPPDAGTLPDMRGIGIYSLRPAEPMRYYAPCARSTVEAKQTANKATVTYKGLEARVQDGSTFAPDMEFCLELSIDAETGDLLIRTSAKANIAPVNDIRDRGIAEVGVLLPGLAPDLRIVLPVAGGVSFARDAFPTEWRPDSPARWGWPRGWEAALFVGAGKKGSFGIWADEPKLDYGRRMALCRDGENWQAALAFETTDVIYHCDAFEGAQWRLNVFEGDWRAPAQRYREQMHAQWPETKGPLPDWAKSVQVMVAGLPADTQVTDHYGALTSPAALAVFSAEGWGLDPKPEAISDRLGAQYAPACLLSRGKRDEEFGKRVQAIEGKRVRVFVPHSPTCVTSSVWERRFPEAAAELAGGLGVGGIFQDASWSLRRRVWSIDNGWNPFNGFSRLQEYWRDLAPSVGWMGERANEVSARGPHFALDVSRLSAYAHPVTCHLLGSSIRTWDLSPAPDAFDAHDIRGWLTTWPSSWKAEPHGAEAMLRQRGVLFAKRQLTSIWPGDWGAEVLHYWRGSGGAEYRSVRDRGTRFVRVSGGQEETLWWRVHGVRQVESPGMGVPGWVAYDGDRLVGLDPGAVYFPENGVERPPAVISAVPDGVAIECCVLRDGFWVVRLKSTGTSETGEEQKARQTELNLVANGEIKVSGVSEVTEKGNGRYEVTVSVPAGFAVSWRKAQPLVVGEDLSEFPVPVSYHDLNSGALVEALPPFQKGELKHEAGAIYPARASICWLLDMPMDRSVLTFKYGSGAAGGDGANYYVRVNGKTVWHEYREEEKAKGKAGPKPEEAEINLSAYIMKTIVLEFATDGHLSGVKDQAAWVQPKLKAKEQTEEPTLMDDMGL